MLMHYGHPNGIGKCHHHHQVSPRLGLKWKERVGEKKGKEVNEVEGGEGDDVLPTQWLWRWICYHHAPSLIPLPYIERLTTMP